MLEPRRIAARAAADFIARQRRERTGESVGYRIRGDSRISKSTKLEVVTEGILTRMIQDDPALEQVGMLIFDEFHERSVHVDLALALSLEVQRALRPDLRIAVMSATIDAEKVSALIGNGAIVRSPGRQFPVEMRYLAQPIARSLDLVVIDSIKRAIREESGDILVFLPGRGEIQRIAERLEPDQALADVDVLRLHSDVSGSEQDRVLYPAENKKRRLILATNIAETSVTIPGVRIVVDSGLMRAPRFNLRRGIAGLETVSVSRASADQRAGRAGRQESGVCYRLWTERQQGELPPFNDPEILHTDLTSLLLELAAWGSIDMSGYAFLTVPADAHIKQSQDILHMVGALDSQGKITPHGKQLLGLSLHPRLAHLLLKAKDTDLAEQACDVAAMLEAQPVSGDRDLDQILSNRFESLRDFRSGKKISHHMAWQRIDQEAQRLQRLIGISQKSQKSDSSSFGILTALAYPERVAIRREQNGLRYLLRSGTGAAVAERSPLARHEFLAVAHLDGSGSNARIFLAEPLTSKEIEEVFSEDIQAKREIFWDTSSQSVRGREVRALGSLLLTDKPVAASDEEALPIMLRALQELTFAKLPLRRSASPLRDRVEWLRSRGISTANLPNLSDELLTETMEEWLSPFISGFRKLSELGSLDLDQVLSPFLPYQTVQTINKLAPSEVELPSGRYAPIDYSGERAPSISARLQELFGQARTPSIAEGKIPLTIHLLSPASRPLQVTADLESFWKNSYEQVRKEMQGRYPKHSWPIDPLTAEPRRGVKKR